MVKAASDTCLDKTTLNEAEIKVSLLESRVGGRRVGKWAGHKFCLLDFPGTAIAKA